MSRAKVHVGWKLTDESKTDFQKFEKLMREAESANLVIVWDDGRGKDMWYEAYRGPEERELRDKVVLTLGENPYRVSVW